MNKYILNNLKEVYNYFVEENYYYLKITGCNNTTYSKMLMKLNLAMRWIK